MSKAIRIASLIWGASILASRFVGLLRESVIGRTLGGGSAADVYWTAFVLPDYLNYLLAGGALSIVFIPLFQAHLQKNDEEGAWRAFSVIAHFLGGALLLLTAVLWWLTPEISQLIAKGFNEAQLQDLTRLTRIILPAQIFHLLGGLLSATLQARDHHAMPALAPLVYTGSIVLSGLLFGERFGADAFAYGVLVGSALGPFGLCLVAALRHGLRWMPVISFRDPDFKCYLLRSLPIMLGLSLVVVDDWLLKHFGSSVGEGAIAKLQYARTLMHVPMGVFGLAAGVATFPTLTRLFANGQREQLWETLASALKMTLFLAFGAEVVLSFAGADVARAIWGTRRFDAASLQEIGLLCTLFCAGLWAWAAQSLVARGFYAQGQTLWPVLVGTISSLGFFSLYGVLSRFYGTKGLAIASSISISVYLVALLVLLKRSLRLDHPHWGGIPLAFLKMCAATAITLGVGLPLRGFWPETQTFMGAVLRALGLSLLSGGLFLGICALLRLDEVKQLFQMGQRILHRKRA